MVRRHAAVLSPGPSRAAALCLLALAAVAASMVVATMLPAPRSVDQYRVATYVGGLVFFWLVAAAIVGFALVPPWRTRWLVVGAVVALAGSIALNVAQVAVASDIAKVAFATLAGFALTRAFERLWWVLPIGLFVPLADVWSVFSERGVTSQVVAKGREQAAWIDWPTVAVPVPGYGYDDFARLGIVDFLFMALFIAVAMRWQLGVLRTALVLPLALVAATVLATELADTAVPALPLLCLAFLVMHARPIWRNLRADLADAG